MHLPGQRASRCPQEDDLFRPYVAAIFVGVARNPLVQHLSGCAFTAMLCDEVKVRTFQPVRFAFSPSPTRAASVKLPQESSSIK